jgi:hypothetical protein
MVDSLISLVMLNKSIKLCAQYLSLQRIDSNILSSFLLSSILKKKKKKKKKKQNKTNILSSKNSSFVVAFKYQI